MLTLAPFSHAINRRIFPRTPALRDLATKSWTIGPGHSAIVPPAFFLDNQLERVTGWEFSGEHPRRQMEGGYEVDIPPTRGYLLDDVLLVDGHLYKGRSCDALHPKTGLLPRMHVEREFDRAAIYSSDWGLKWFGAWLLVDCLTYKLVETNGVPVAPNYAIWPHTKPYERMLGMAPVRVDGAFLRQAVVFGDLVHTNDRAARSAMVREQLLSSVRHTSHPGVFILRGSSGERRLLSNELAIAERLERTRGFKIADPEKMSVEQLLALCAGARTVAGVEGSQLIHGIAVLEEGGNVLALQPPARFVGDYKHRTDRDQQNFGFVVGTPNGADFLIDPEEVERTLDLFPRESRIASVLAL